jgi:DNA-directed RNA polymerase subunit L
MRIRILAKRKNDWEFQLRSEDHTFANLVRELCWENGGEATYKVEHSLLGEPVVRVISPNPGKVLRKVAKDVVKLSEGVEKAFSK